MKFRTLLLGLSALFVAFNAAFFSVTGLSKLFAGASLSVMLMASSLEAAKLITAGYLYNYWEKINKLFRVYLIIGTSILVLITSLGIYGFLTAAFQDTLNVYNVTSKQKAFLQQKEKFWGDDVARYDEELQSISQRIEQLSNAKSQQIQVRDTTSTTGFRTTVSTAELRLAQQRLGVEEETRKEIQSKRQVAADSLQSIQIKILDLDTDTETGSELGPLQYLSGLLDKPMDEIINWFILIIIFVFDPLAVALVIAFNNALKVDKGEDDKKKIVSKRELYGEKPDEEESSLWDNTLNDGLEDDEWDEDHALDQVLNDMVEDIEVKDAEELSTNKEFIETLDKIESKHNTDLDLDGDGIISEEELLADIDGDGIISEEEKREWYENGGWRTAYQGRDYWFHPWFDWSKTNRWVNNQRAVDYWLKNRGGSTKRLQKIKNSNKYPEDFDSKTY
jgi:hypothetical protein